MINKIFFGFVLIGLFQSCVDSEKKIVQESVKSNTEARRIMLSQIDSLEAIVYVDSFSLNDASTSTLLQTYLKYTRLFVGDQEKTPEFLYKSAALSRAAGLPGKAIKLYEQIITDYPTYIRNPEVAFLIAFTYDEEIKSSEEAKIAYQNVIEKYPGDMWATQASERLKTIDMTDEELIEQFMKNQSSDS